MDGQTAPAGPMLPAAGAMKVGSAWTAFLPVAALAACAARPTPGLYVTPFRAQAGGSAEACTIAGKMPNTSGSEIEVFDSERLDKPFAFISKRAPVTVGRLPRRVATAADGRARVLPTRIDTGGQRLLRFGGWTALSRLSFRVRDKVDIVSTHIWMISGTKVEVRGTDGALIAVRVRTGFVAPEYLDGFTTCGNLEYAPDPSPSCDQDRLAPNSEKLSPRKPTVTLWTAPRGTPIAVLALSPTATVLPGVERRPGWVRIVLGQASGLAVDAWIGEREVGPWQDAMDRESCCGSSEKDRCPDLPSKLASVPADAEVIIGPSPSAGVRAVAEAGATLRLRERRGEHFAFELPGGEIAPASGSKLWIRERDIVWSPPWVPWRPEDEDDCPE
jgi:hypothetical protein